jgi:hypothetical protein
MGFADRPANPFLGIRRFLVPRDQTKEPHPQDRLPGSRHGGETFPDTRILFYGRSRPSAMPARRRAAELPLASAYPAERFPTCGQALASSGGSRPAWHARDPANCLLWWGYPRPSAMAPEPSLWACDVIRPQAAGPAVCSCPRVSAAADSWLPYSAQQDSFAGSL